VNGRGLLLVTVLARASFQEEVELAGAAVGTFLDISTDAPLTQIGTLSVGVGTRVDRLDSTADGWALELDAP